MIWRWLELPIDQPGAEFNMALDKALMDSLVEKRAPQTVRAYRWPEKCVTLGRLQKMCEARGSYPILPLYQRPTGGRAVEHGDDLTVTVAADEKCLRELSGQSGILASYYQVLAGVISTIESYGVVTATGFSRLNRKSADCFHSIGKCDVVDAATGNKIVGCAQLRSRGAVLQQMSLRPHERYHIETREFLSKLKANLAECLGVDRWETFDTDLPSEYLRTSAQRTVR